MDTTSPYLPFRRVIPLLLWLGVVFVVVWRLPALPVLVGANVMPLSVHMATEVFSIAIAAMVFGVSYGGSRERPLPMVFLGCALLAVGLLDFAHMLSFKGMPDFVTPADREKSLNFWLAGRLVFAAAVVAFPLLPWRPSANSRHWLLAASLAFTALIYWLGLYHQELWPRTYVPGLGLTPFKIGAEYTAIALMLLAAALLLRQARSASPPYDAVSLFAALGIICLSELSFTLYADVTDIFNLLGHLYKIVAYAFIYRAVFVTNVQEPFARLRQTNEELRQVRKQYTALAELAPVGIFQTDAQGRCHYVNDRWMEMAGLSYAEAMGEGWVKALHPDDRGRVVALWGDVLREQKGFQGEFRFLRPDGRMFWLYGQAKAETDEGGRFVGYVGTITDITTLVTARELLRQSEERFRIIMDGLDSLVYVADMDTYELLFINRYGRDHWGDVIGKKCWQALQNGQDGPCVFCTNDRLLSADGLALGVYVWEFQNTVTGQWFSCRDQAIRWPDGRQVRLEIATDISEIKGLEGQLRQTQKMEAIGTLAGGIAHDFNNILTPILGYAEIMAEQLPADSPLAEPAQEVFKAGVRARELVKQILTFSRQTEQERHPIQVHLVVKEALKLLRASLPSNIEIRQDVVVEDDLVVADPTMVHQVVMNLCTNAYHAMRETGGVLAVFLTGGETEGDDTLLGGQLSPGPYLRLTVSDTGSGMSPQIRERIFEPYFTTKAQGEGTGLGLSVVHGIVKSLGGHIAVESEPYQGATFHVYLPRYREAEMVNAAVIGAPLPLPRGSEHILVVDDEESIAELLTRSLTSLGYQVTTCLDSRQALELVERQARRYDLLLTDMIMPYLTGAELASRVLAMRPDLPVILCTGFSEIIDEEKATALGIRQMLMKPVLRDQLARVIREVLDPAG